MVLAGAAVAVAVADEDLGVARPPEHDGPLVVGQVLPRRVGREAVRLCDGLEHAVEVLEPPARPWADRPTGDGAVGVGHDELGVDLQVGADAVAAGAGPVGGVEGEVAGRQLVEGQAADGAGQVLAEGEDLGLALALPGNELDLGHALGQPQRRLQGVGQPPLDARPLDQPVDDDLDGVLLVAGQLGWAGQLVDLAVDAGPHEALAGQLLQQPLVLALPAPHHRRQHLEAGAVGQVHDAVDDLLGGLAGDWPSTHRAVGLSDPGVEKPEVVVDLGDRAHG